MMDRYDAYVKRIYAYAARRTYTREEADELTQEILFTAVKAAGTLKDDSKFEAWLFGIADNVTKGFRRHAARRRAMYSYDALESLSYEDAYFDGEEFELLREKIARMSRMYRDIIVYHYYDGLSTKQISELLSLPEGTVKWRLGEARRKLKKELMQMNETALRPVKVDIGIYGNGNYDGNLVPFPSDYVSDALSQNILYYCYDKARTVEEISEFSGVPAYYVEDKMETLLRREAVIREGKGKYRTDFIIFSDKHAAFIEKNAERVLMPVMDRLISALKAISLEAQKIDFYRAGKSQQDLFYLYGVMAFLYARNKYSTLLYPPFEKSYDGYSWRYLGNMESGTYKNFRIGTQHSANLGSGGCVSHSSFSGIPNTGFRPMMKDCIINACADLLLKGEARIKQHAAEAIEEGYIVKKPEGEFMVTTPFFNMEQMEAFNQISDRRLSPLMGEYNQAVEALASEYRELFPKHLHKDADRMCNHLFNGMYSVIIDYAQRNKMIDMPSKDCFVDVLVEYRKE